MSKKTDGSNAAVSDKLRRAKSREVSSRFLNFSTPIEKESAPLNPTRSPLWQNPKSNTNPSSSPADDVASRKPRNQDSGFISRLWPASTPKTSAQSNKKKGTLAQHLGDERQKDLIDRKLSDHKPTGNLSFLNRQKSCSTEFRRFDNDKQSSTKENHKPFFGGSMRYTGKFKFPGTSSTSSSSDSNLTDDGHIIPGRLSVDENALRQRSFGGRSDISSENQDSGSECSDFDLNTSLGSPLIGKGSPASYMLATVSSSSRKSGIEVSSKYMTERFRRGTSDSHISVPAGLDNSPKKNNVNGVKHVKRANSLTIGSSPGRLGSPPVESKVGLAPYSNMKPPTSPSKGKLPPTSPSRPKGVGNLINLGLDLFKSKKPFPSSSGGGTVALGLSTGENVHQLRLLHNRLVQWRYTNARSEIVNENIASQAESKLLCASEALTQLQLSVLQKKLQLEKEKLEIKLQCILRSQMKPLEAWSDMERQHLSAVLMITDSLHSVVCKVPLVEGAMVEPESASFALRYASDLAVSLKSMLSTFSPTAEKTVEVLAELAEVAAQEKLMLEECLELSRFISTLEMEERSLKCSVIQLQSQQQQHQHVITA